MDLNIETAPAIPSTDKETSAATPYVVVLGTLAVATVVSVVGYKLKSHLRNIAEGE